MWKKIIILLLILFLGFILFRKSKENMSICNIENLDTICEINDLDAKKIEKIIRYCEPKTMKEMTQAMKDNNIDNDIIYKFDKEHILDFYLLKSNFDCDKLKSVINKIKQ
jgi:hypothetical protein